MTELAYKWAAARRLRYHQLMPSKVKPTIRTKPRRSFWRRAVLGVLLASPFLVLGLWIAVNRIEWLGPWVADGLRAVIGKDAVAELEDIAYGVQDRFYQYYRKGESPKAYWQVPTAAPEAAGPKAEEPAAGASGDGAGAEGGGSEALSEAIHRPKDVGPVHASWSAPGDGQWLPIAVPDLPALTPRMWKTLLHPDKNRSWAEVFIVALDVQRINLHLVAGSQEPIATEPGAENVERKARVPEHHEAEVLAAFNGGFKTEHGGYGMRVGATTLVKPVAGACAVAWFNDHHVEVAPWEKLAAREAQMTWWRQTPNCMLEDGKLHPRLVSGHTTKWGATLDGDTVIRRSAIGVDPSGQLLFVGISNHTSANAIADALLHAGAITVAQLDVNFSYPKFVLFERAVADGPRLAIALADGFEFSTDEYIRKRSQRDFFYLTAREAKEASAR
jgi:hypothetical protein